MNTTPPRPSRPEERLETRVLRPDLGCVIAVTGWASNVGKTTLTEDILRALAQEERPAQAVKVTRTHLGTCPRENDGCLVCDSLLGDYRLETDEAELSRKGKDTARYGEAGAAEVSWLLVNPEKVAVGVRAVFRALRPGLPVVVEGNSFRDYADADLCFMVASADEEPKASARTILDRADIVVCHDDEREAVLRRSRAAGAKCREIMDFRSAAEHARRFAATFSEKM